MLTLYVRNLLKTDAFVKVKTQKCLFSGALYEYVQQQDSLVGAT